MRIDDYPWSIELAKLQKTNGPGLIRLQSALNWMVLRDLKIKRTE